jgi:hypothetical protein
MDALVLIALIGGAFALCFWHDARGIATLAAEHGWRELRVAWAPLARFLAGRRNERHYWLRYLDERGRPVRRLCKVVGFLHGAAGVFLEPVASAPPARARPPGRATRIVLWAVAGAFLGGNLGIAACFAIVPGSNIAPAYGLILGAPLGLVVGASLAALRRS